MRGEERRGRSSRCGAKSLKESEVLWPEEARVERCVVRRRPSTEV